MGVSSLVALFGCLGSETPRAPPWHCYAHTSTLTRGISFFHSLAQQHRQQHHPRHQRQQQQHRRGRQSALRSLAAFAHFGAGKFVLLIRVDSLLVGPVAVLPC